MCPLVGALSGEGDSVSLPALLKLAFYLGAGIPAVVMSALQPYMYLTFVSLIGTCPKGELVAIALDNLDALIPYVSDECWR